jgi:hypothetical protein
MDKLGHRERFKQAKGTHFLESADGQTSQDMKNVQAESKAALTSWRAQMDRQVIT